MQRIIARELMDDDETVGTLDLWRASLADLARVNAWLGGWNVLRSELARLPRLPTRVLDVATGGGDLPRRLLEYLSRRGVPATCVAVDRSARILRLAEEAGAKPEGLIFMKADARSLPFDDASFDLATLNLALHHFDPPEAIQVLRELARVGRTVIVNDLRRSWIAWGFARYVFPLFTRNPFTCNDGPLSVLRAYAAPELHYLARSAGWRRIDIRIKPGFRMALIGGVLA